MIPFTYNNYYTCYSSNNLFTINLTQATRIPGTYIEEAKIAAKHIADNKKGKLLLLYSGGVDSEFMLNVFLDCKIDFTPVIIRLLPDYNNHDLKYAYQFCQSNNLSPLIIDIDFNTFVDSGTINVVAEKGMCGWYELTTTLYVEQLLSNEGTIITGSGEPDFIKKDNEWHFIEYQEIYSRFLWRTINKINGTPFFLGYTPEMMLSFLNNKKLVSLFNDKQTKWTHTNNYKKFIYNQYYKMKHRPKYTGFEVIAKSEISNHQNMLKFKDYNKQWGNVYMIRLDKLKTLLSGENNCVEIK